MNDISQTLLNKITEIENQIVVENFSDVLDYYNKIVKALDTLKNRIKSQASLLFNNSNITSAIQNNLNNLSSNIKNFQDTKNGACLNNINNSLNSIISSINNIPVNLKGETLTNLNKILESFETNNLSIINQLKKEKTDLEIEIKELKKQIGSLEKRLDIKNKDLDSISINQQKQFSDAQERRLNEFSDKLKYFEKEFEKQKEEQSNNYISTFDELKKTAENKLQLMEGIKTKIEKIYNIVGQEAVVGSQKAYADKAKTFANWLFVLSILLMIAFAIVVIWPVFQVIFADLMAFDNTKTFADINWEILLCRIPIAALLLLPAVYMANESKKQRDKENKYRELEIKMAAIEPYFNNICEKCKDTSTQLPEKDAVKLELAKALLSPNTDKTNENIIIPKDILDLVKEIVKITTLSKK